MATNNGEGGTTGDAPPAYAPPQAYNPNAIQQTVPSYNPNAIQQTVVHATSPGQPQVQYAQAPAPNQTPQQIQYVQPNQAPNQPQVQYVNAQGQPVVLQRPNQAQPRIQYVNAQGQPIVMQQQPNVQYVQVAQNGPKVMYVQPTAQQTAQPRAVVANNNNATNNNGEYEWRNPQGCNKALRTIACIFGAIAVLFSFIGMCVDQLATYSYTSYWTIDCGWTEVTLTSETTTDWGGTDTDTTSNSYADACDDGYDDACSTQGGAVVALIFVLIATISGAIGVLITFPCCIVSRCCCHKYQGHVMFLIAFITTLIGLIIYVSTDDYCLGIDGFDLGATWGLCITAMVLYFGVAIMAR